MLIILNLIFFRSQFADKKISAPDEVNYIAASSEVRQYAAQGTAPSFWTNSLFSGMPTYQIEKLPLAWTPFDLIKSALGLFFDPMVSYFIAMSLLCFICLLIIGINPWLAGIGSVAFSFTSGHFAVAASGHYTKLDSLVYLPLIFAGLQLIFNQRKLLGIILFTTGLLFNIQANHIQMTYYIFLVIGVYVIVELIKSVQTKSFKPFIEAGACIVAGIIVSFLGNIAHLYMMKDYAEETVRGKMILTQTKEDQPANGLEWNYASEFSYGYLDLVSMVVPGFVGGSSSEKTSPTSALAEDFRKKSKKVPDPFIAPLYWGSMPFSSGPAYTGILSFILFCIGIIYIKSNIKYWALATMIVLLFISLGDHFFLNKLLFQYLPYFNKFRSPDSILLVAGQLIPWFGIFTANELFKNKWKEKDLKVLLKKAATPMIILSLIAFAGFFLFDFRHEADKIFWSNEEAMIDTRRGYMFKELWRSIGLALALLVALYYALLHKMNRNYFFGGFALLMLLDLLPIARRSLSEKAYVATEQANQLLDKTEGNVQILRDRGHFRVLDKANNTFNDAFASLYHNSIGGYHPAKLRRYEDMITGYLQHDHPGSINMLNAKYIITKNGEITTNANAAGNAWFVDTVITANTPNEEFDYLKDLDIKHQAVYLKKDFAENIPSTFSPNGAISLTKYKPDQLTYKYNTISPQLAVFSEVWYGPHKGWHAYIDGKEVEHVRVNYLLRALNVPAGSHTIEFKFYPDTIWFLIKLNRVILWVLLGAIIMGITWIIRKRHSLTNHGDKIIAGTK